MLFPWAVLHLLPNFLLALSTVRPAQPVRFSGRTRSHGSERSWRIAVNPHFQVTYFGSVVNHIVARNARYLIRSERTHNRGVSRIFVKAAHARMAVQTLQVAVEPSRWIVFGGVLTYSI